MNPFKFVEARRFHLFVSLIERTIGSIRSSPRTSQITNSLNFVAIGGFRFPSAFFARLELDTADISANGDKGQRTFPIDGADHVVEEVEHFQVWDIRRIA